MAVFACGELKKNMLVILIQLVWLVRLVWFSSVSSVSYVSSVTLVGYVSSNKPTNDRIYLSINKSMNERMNK